MRKCLSKPFHAAAALLEFPKETGDVARFPIAYAKVKHVAARIDCLRMMDAGDQVIGIVVQPAANHGATAEAQVSRTDPTAAARYLRHHVTAAAAVPPDGVPTPLGITTGTREDV